MNFRLFHHCLSMIACLVVAAGCASSKPKEFSSPDAAATSLVDALRTDNRARLDVLLAPAADDILSSGDPVADRADETRFLTLYDAGHRIEAGPDGIYTLVVGPADWPFPVPIVKSKKGYEFDAAAGREEIVNRRIGRNELDAQQVCLAIVDAQRDYAALRPMGGDLPQYAQKVVSDPGTKDGLYWPTTAAEPPSPLGLLVASAAAEGYGGASRAATRPAYHGYHYRLITAQGPHAKGGELQYMVDGRLIGGFAVLAYPAQYGNSGIMTFITSHDGIVYQRDFGPDTEKLAQAVTTFDPGPEWTRVADSGQVAQRD